MSIFFHLTNKFLKQCNAMSSMQNLTLLVSICILKTKMLIKCVTCAKKDKIALIGLISSYLVY